MKKDNKVKVKWMIGYYCPKCRELFKQGEDICDDEGTIVHYKCKKGVKK